MELHFIYATIWALGGTLEAKDREPFSVWWRETFGQFVKLPEGNVSDMLNNITFVNFKDFQFSKILHQLVTVRVFTCRLL